MQRRKRRFSGSTKSWRIRLVRADWEHRGVGWAVWRLCGADWGSSWASPAWFLGLGMLWGCSRDAFRLRRARAPESRGA